MREYREDEDVDFLIVGTGAGGGTLACRLAEHGFSVVALDAGPYWRPLEDFASDETHQSKLYWTDERIVGDMLMHAFAVAVDRVLEASASADREIHLQRAVESHRLIGQAIGILIERHRLSSTQAFDMLKQASMDRNIKLREIASRVIETGAEPSEAP